MFVYKSPVGEMLIFRDLRENGIALSINGTIYGHYESAVAAADDVQSFSTGCYEWDSLDDDFEDAPSDIYEWHRVTK